MILVEPLVCVRLIASGRRVIIGADQARRLAAAGAAEPLDPLPSPPPPMRFAKTARK